MQKAITNIDKKIFFIFLSILFPAALSAQEAGLQGITSTTEGVGNYIPVVQGLCFVIAAAIGIAGSVYAYYQVQKGEQPEKYVVGTVGSAMTFVVMALFLPQFFGYTSSPSEGLIAQNGGGGGDSTSAIDTSIPDMDDPRWQTEVTRLQILEEYGTNNNNVIDIFGLYDEYTSRFPNSLKGCFKSPSILLDAIDFVGQYGFDFNLAESVADANAWQAAQQQAAGLNPPLGCSYYMDISSAIYHLRNICKDVTWWRYSGEISPPPSEWCAKF